MIVPRTYVSVNCPTPEILQLFSVRHCANATARILAFFPWQRLLFLHSQPLLIVGTKLCCETACWPLHRRGSLPTGIDEPESGGAAVATPSPRPVAIIFHNFHRNPGKFPPTAWSYPRWVRRVRRMSVQASWHTPIIACTILLSAVFQRRSNTARIFPVHYS